MITRILVSLRGTERTVSPINHVVALAMTHDADVTGVKWMNSRVNCPTTDSRHARMT